MTLSTGELLSRAYHATGPDKARLMEQARAAMHSEAAADMERKMRNAGAGGPGTAAIMHRLAIEFGDRRWR